LGVAAAAILGGAVWFISNQGPTEIDDQRAVREALGLAQPEEFVFAYPVTGTPEPLSPRCDIICARREVTAGKDLARVGEGPQGFWLVDAPPAGCSLLSLRYRDSTVAEVTDEPLPVMVDAAPLYMMEECNPDAPVRIEGGLTQVPAWYRTQYGIAVSVPSHVIDLAQTFRVAVCARDNNGEIRQFLGADDQPLLVPESTTYCGDI
jgi:hypothetical protein